MQHANKTLVRSTTEAASVKMSKPLFIARDRELDDNSNFIYDGKKMYVFGIQALHTCINKHMYTHTHTHTPVRPHTQNAGSKLSKQYEIYVLPLWFLRVPGHT